MSLDSACDPVRIGKLRSRRDLTARRSGGLGQGRGCRNWCTDPFDVVAMQKRAVLLERASGCIELSAARLPAATHAADDP